MWVASVLVLWLLYWVSAINLGTSVAWHQLITEFEGFAVDGAADCTVLERASNAGRKDSDERVGRSDPHLQGPSVRFHV